MSNAAIRYIRPSDTKRKAPRLIGYKAARELIVNSTQLESLPENARPQLEAIVSHWLQFPETNPILLNEKYGDVWRKLLATKADSRLEKANYGKPRVKRSGLYGRVNFRGIPFPPVSGERFTFIDLFAGIGGFRIALRSLGGKCVFSSEWNLYSQKTYDRNFGEMPFGDIKIFTDNTVSNAQIRRWIPDHDILTAGFPCQPFSKAGVSARNSLGRTHGFACKTQGTLFFDVIRIANAKRPKVLLLENVKNLVRHDNGNTFKIIQKAIRDIGYSFEPILLDASTLVPQRRQRYYLVCFRDSNEPFPFLPFTGKPKALKSILQKNPEARYTISERLWKGHQNRTARNRSRGVGFTALKANIDLPANTLVARYYKDGKECLVPLPTGGPPRKLTPKECARLQGFPEKFKPNTSDSQAYRQFGNSVAIPVVRKVAIKILKKLGK